MFKSQSLKRYVLLLTVLLSVPTQAAIDKTLLVNEFVEQMVAKYYFERPQVEAWLNAAEIKPAILDAISSPAEGMSWYKYRKIFMTEKRIAGGVDFWQKNAVTLAKVSSQYGVPAEIIIAIIGVETQYGGNVGTYRVLDALATLGFAHPKRSAFFLSELEHFLLLCREEHIDPTQPLGSYAGAMGLPQFMPSSYRDFAVDFEQDKQRNIWTNPADAIASVANYFVKHQWQPGAEVFVPAVAEGYEYKVAIRNELEPDLTTNDLRRLKIGVMDTLAADGKVKLLAFEQEFDEDLWLGLHNYYVITRYNRSPLYAMAVYQLSQAIADRRQIKTASGEKNLPSL
ncbi:MAG: lytic murein transglycosylase B [Methylococcaceae bacterium]|nr:lytic murein transglycosylase B [Methylococcaceae bacterium]